MPQRNPFGNDKAPNDFATFDIYTKIQILHQLSVWTLINPERIRERLPGKEYDQTQWVGLYYLSVQKSWLSLTEL